MTEAPGAARPLVLFRVGGELFGLDIGAVREVVRDRAAAALEGANFVMGSVAIRGERIPLIDLRQRFGFGGPDGASSRLLLVQHPDAGALALRVDAATEVRAVPAGDIVPAPDYFARFGSELLQGLARSGGEIIIVLDLGHLLSRSEVETLQRLAKAEPGTGADGR